MKVNPLIVNRLTEALKQQRQLTLAEQHDAEDLLRVLRREAENILGGPVAPEPGDPPDLRRAKQKGLTAVARCVESGEVGFAEIADLLHDLMPEVLRGYVAHESHRKGTPTQVIIAQNARMQATYDDRVSKAEAEVAELRDAYGARLNALEALFKANEGTAQGAHDRLNATLPALESRIAAVESAVPSERPSTVSVIGDTLKGK